MRTLRRLALACAITTFAAGCSLLAVPAQARPDEADAPSRFQDRDHDRGRDDDDRDDRRHGHGREPIRVKIVGFNDYHGNLQSPGTFGVNTLVPAANRPAVGGAEYLAAYVARMKAQNVNTVVVGAGDFIGASPLISALFFDEPAVETLNRIGVDFNAVGNHEFDKGAAELRRLQNGGCKLTEAGVPDPNSCKGLGSNAPGTFCSKIVDVVLTPTDLSVTPPVATGAPETIVANGVVQNPAKTYRVTVNNFIATGGDGFTVLQGGTNVLGGAQDIDALTAYLGSGYKAPKAPYDPALPALGIPRITMLP